MIYLPAGKAPKQQLHCIFSSHRSSPLASCITRLKSATNCHCYSLLSNVRDSSQRALGSACPWEALIRHLNVPDDVLNVSVFETMVTFHEDYHTLDLPSGLRPIYTTSSGAKFPLMVEFIAASESKLFLRLEVSDGNFQETNLADFAERLVRVLHGLTQGWTTGQISSITQGILEGERLAPYVEAFDQVLEEIRDGED